MSDLEVTLTGIQTGVMKIAAAPAAAPVTRPLAIADADMPFGAKISRLQAGGDLDFPWGNQAARLETYLLAQQIAINFPIDRFVIEATNFAKNTVETADRQRGLGNFQLWKSLASNIQLDAIVKIIVQFGGITPATTDPRFKKIDDFRDTQHLMIQSALIFQRNLVLTNSGQITAGVVNPIDAAWVQSAFGPSHQDLENRVAAQGAARIAAAWVEVLGNSDFDTKWNFTKFFGDICHAQPEMPHSVLFDGIRPLMPDWPDSFTRGASGFFKNIGDYLPALGIIALAVGFAGGVALLGGTAVAGSGIAAGGSSLGLGFESMAANAAAGLGAAAPASLSAGIGFASAETTSLLAATAGAGLVTGATGGGSLGLGFESLSANAAAASGAAAPASLSAGVGFASSETTSLLATTAGSGIAAGAAGGASGLTGLLSTEAGKLAAVGAATAGAAAKDEIKEVLSGDSGSSPASAPSAAPSGAGQLIGWALAAFAAKLLIFS